MESTTPSAWSIALASAIVSGLAGYFLGQASSIGVFGNDSQPTAIRASEADVSDAESDSETETDEKLVADHAPSELSAFTEHKSEECKLVLVVRSDLGMTKGKIAAQCGHATLACYKTLDASKTGNTVLRRWERLGQAKIAVKCDSEAEMEELQATALSLGICAEVIHDAGRTQIAAGSATVLGIGPAPKSVVNAVTGHLKLL